MDSPDTTEEMRINARIKGVLASHVKNRIGPNGVYENQSEYIRDLIRHDKENQAVKEMAQVIRESNADIVAGRYFKSTGDYYKDKKIFEEKEKKGWR